MKRDIEDLRVLDTLIKVTAVLLLIVAIIITFLLIDDVSHEAYAEPVKITFQEQIKHDEDIVYQQWEVTQTTSSLSHDTETSNREYIIEVTQEDVDLMARVVMSEASILSDDAKQAIATTIVNRVRDKESEFRCQNTVKEVVYHGNAYSTQDNGEPDETCYQAVYNALTYDAFPAKMFYFRQNYYHAFGIEYTNIGSTYFSLGE